MKEKLNKELEEVDKKIKKNELKIICSLLIYGVIASIGVTNIFPFIENCILINNLNSIQSFVIYMCIIVPSLVPLFLLRKTIKKTSALFIDRYVIEDLIKEQEIISDIEFKYEKLSQIQQEKIIQYISSYDQDLEEIFLDIDELDEVNLRELRRRLEEKRSNKDVIQENDSAYLRDVNIDLVDYIINEIDAWCFEVPQEIMEVILNDIKNDKKLLLLYFPEVEWNEYLIEIVYDRIFNKEKNRGSSYTKKRVK